MANIAIRTTRTQICLGCFSQLKAIFETQHEEEKLPDATPTDANTDWPMIV